MLVPVPGGRPALPTRLRLNVPLPSWRVGSPLTPKEHLGSGARGLPPGYTDSAHIFSTPVSGVGGGCLRVSLPRVSELEETSGSLCPPGGCASLTQLYCLQGEAESPVPQVLWPL